MSNSLLTLGGLATRNNLVQLGGEVRPIIPIEKRAPLPPFDPNCLTSLPGNSYIPLAPQKNFPISNWFSVEVPGLPFIPGFSSSEHPHMLMTYGLPLYDDIWYEPSLIGHAKRGYSHFMLHYGVARDDAGWSIPTFVDLCKLVKQYIPFCHVMLYGKNDKYKDTQWDDVNGIQSVVRPVLEALITANAVDMVSMFETDNWNIPGNGGLDGILFGIGNICKQGNVDQWLHLTTYRTSWQEDAITRGEWWKRFNGTLTGLLFQGDVAWSMEDRQNIIGWTLNKPSAMPQFCDGTFKFCAAEMDGMSVFNVNFSEDISDLHGWEHLCTSALQPVWGCCSGSRRPDGSSLLKVAHL